MCLGLSANCDMGKWWWWWWQRQRQTKKDYYKDYHKDDYRECFLLLNKKKIKKNTVLVLLSIHFQKFEWSSVSWIYIYIYFFFIFKGLFVLNTQVFTLHRLGIYGGFPEQEIWTNGQRSSTSTLVCVMTRIFWLLLYEISILKLSKVKST